MPEHFYEFWLAGTDTLPNANRIVDFLESVAFGDAWIERLVCVICATWGRRWHLRQAQSLVASTSGGVTCYANADNAWLVPPDAESFAQAVRAIRNDPETAGTRSREARATAEAFD
jgi:glycosyltransferase involved in cell wall biosynthesis